MWNCPPFRSSTTGATSGEETAHLSKETRLVLLVETKYLLFRNNMTGATSGGGTAYSSEVTRRVLLVDEELSTLQK